MCSDYYYYNITDIIGHRPYLHVIVTQIFIVFILILYNLQLNNHTTKSAILAQGVHFHELHALLNPRGTYILTIFLFPPTQPLARLQGSWGEDSLSRVVSPLRQTLGG